jgi:hypothetical protein
MSSLGGWHRDNSRSCHACGAAAGEGVNLYVSHRGPVLCTQCINDAAEATYKDNPASSPTIKISTPRRRASIMRIAERAKVHPEQVWHYLAGDEEMDAAVRIASSQAVRSDAAKREQGSSDALERVSNLARKGGGP